jgi:glycine/D-amino acid oxidase-like deaminating enzyme
MLTLYRQWLCEERRDCLRKQAENSQLELIEPNSTDRGVNMADCDVAIIGGGLIGCASAYYLSKAGAKVVLLERGQLNGGASGQNAGSLHFQLEHRLIRDLEVRQRDLAFYVGLAKIAIELWQGVDAELGSETGISMHGGLMVAESPDDVALLERKARIERGQGLEVELLDRDRARELAPYLSESIQAALYCPLEGHCNPRLLTPAYARRASELGAAVRSRTSVSAIMRDSRGWAVTLSQNPGTCETLRCAAVLNAGGAWAADIAALANVHLPLFPVALTMNVTEKIEPRVPHLVQHVGRKLSLKQTDDGNLLIGGGWRSRLRHHAGKWAVAESPEMLLDSVAGNLRAAVAVVPSIGSLRLLRAWTGTTVNTPDDLPVLGEVPQAPGFFVASGGPGFTFGPAYALLMSELLQGCKTSWPLEPFSPKRFGGLNAYMGC